MFLSKGEDHVKTFLERAEGSPLEIIVGYEVPVQTMALLSSRTKQIGTLGFLNSRWTDLQSFSEVTSGLLPLLHTLGIDSIETLTPPYITVTNPPMWDASPYTPTTDFIDAHTPSSVPLHPMWGASLHTPTTDFIDTDTNTDTTEEDDLDEFERNPPSLPLFSNAKNLKALRFHSRSSQSPFVLDFVFPNLASFDLSITKMGSLDFSQLFDFLEASPMLQTVNIEYIGYIYAEEVPPERVVFLPNVEKFTLIVSEGGYGYEMAAHMHCPSARVTSIMLKSTFEMIPEDIFPTPVSWDTILRHYTRSPPEEAILEIRPEDPFRCKLTFGSSDSTTISFGFTEIPDSNMYDHDMFYLDAWVPTIFAQATQAIHNHPQLANIKRLHLCHSFRPSAYVNEQPQTAKEVERLFSFLGPLDEMNIYHCDLRLYFRLSRIPPTKKLILLHPVKLSGCMAGIVSLAKRQHARRMPFERVVIRSDELLEGIEGLTSWVGGVEYSREKLHGWSDEWGLR